jgi:hypothetical protein
MAFHTTTRCHPVTSTTSFLDGEETQVTDPQAFFTALCHLSVAEDAMRKATGESFPPQPCWGCKDITAVLGLQGYPSASGKPVQPPLDGLSQQE